jgi:hypothetical protein
MGGQTSTIGSYMAEWDSFDTSGAGYKRVASESPIESL